MPLKLTLTAFTALVALYIIGSLHREKGVIIVQSSTAWTRKGLPIPPGDAVDCVTRADRNAAPAAAPAAEPEPPFAAITWPDACPDWLLEYEKFHAAHRGQPGAKYLVHHVTGEAGGTGDRIRGMLFSVRAAAAMGRVLLATWDHPYELTNFFIPSGGIDWTLDGISDIQNGTVVQFMNDFYNATIMDGSLLNVTDPWLTFVTNNFMAGQCPWCAPLESPWSEEAACLFHKVLRPTDEIIEMADAALHQLYGVPQPRFIAVHLRLGGLVGEAGTPERGWVGEISGPLPHFLGALRCANALAVNATFYPLTTPTMLVTDNIVLRQFIADGGLPHVVGPAHKPVHTDFADQESVEDHKKTVVDIVLLSRGECLVWSASGFSHMAWLLGGAKPCRVRTTECTPGMPAQSAWRNDKEW